MEQPPSYIAAGKVQRWREMIYCLTRDMGEQPGLSMAEARAYAASALVPRRLILEGETVIGRVKSLNSLGIKQ